MSALDEYLTLYFCQQQPHSQPPTSSPSHLQQHSSSSAAPQLSSAASSQPPPQPHSLNSHARGHVNSGGRPASGVGVATSALVQNASVTNQRTTRSSSSAVAKYQATKSQLMSNSPKRQQQSQTGKSKKSLLVRTKNGFARPISHSAASDSASANATSTATRAAQKRHAKIHANASFSTLTPLDETDQFEQQVHELDEGFDDVPTSSSSRPAAPSPRSLHQYSAGRQHNVASFYPPSHHSRSQSPSASLHSPRASIHAFPSHSRTHSNGTSMRAQTNGFSSPRSSLNGSQYSLQQQHAPHSVMIGQYHTQQSSNGSTPHRQRQHHPLSPLHHDHQHPSDLYNPSEELSLEMSHVSEEYLSPQHSPSHSHARASAASYLETNDLHRGDSPAARLAGNNSSFVSPLSSSFLSSLRARALRMQQMETSVSTAENGNVVVTPPMHHRTPNTPLEPIHPKQDEEEEKYQQQHHRSHLTTTRAHPQRDAKGSLLLSPHLTGRISLVSTPGARSPDGSRCASPESAFVDGNTRSTSHRSTTKAIPPPNANQLRELLCEFKASWQEIEVTSGELVSSTANEMFSTQQQLPQPHQHQPTTNFDLPVTSIPSLPPQGTRTPLRVVEEHKQESSQSSSRRPTPGHTRTSSTIGGSISPAQFISASRKASPALSATTEKISAANLRAPPPKPATVAETINLESFLERPTAVRGSRVSSPTVDDCSCSQSGAMLPGQFLAVPSSTSSSNNVAMLSARKHAARQMELDHVKEVEKAKAASLMNTMSLSSTSFPPTPTTYFPRTSSSSPIRYFSSTTSLPPPYFSPSPSFSHSLAHISTPPPLDHDAFFGRMDRGMEDVRRLSSDVRGHGGRGVFSPAATGKRTYFNQPTMQGASSTYFPTTPALPPSSSSFPHLDEAAYLAMDTPPALNGSDSTAYQEGEQKYPIAQLHDITELTSSIASESQNSTSYSSAPPPPVFSQSTTLPFRPATFASTAPMFAQTIDAPFVSNSANSLSSSRNSPATYFPLVQQQHEHQPSPGEIMTKEQWMNLYGLNHKFHRIDVPQPRLVGIELNPGPSSSIAQSIYADALHSIFGFLDLNSDYSLLHAASTCTQWMSATESMKPLSCVECDDAIDSFGSSLREYQFNRRLVHSQVEILLTSRLRHHVDSLIYAFSRDPCGTHELLSDLSQLHSRMSHLRRLSIPSVSCISVTSSPLMDFSFPLPSQLLSLEISFARVSTRLKSTEKFRQLEFALYSEAFAKMITNNNTSSSSLRHLSLSAQAPAHFTQFPAVAFQPWIDRHALLPSLRSLNIHQPTFECVDLMRTMGQLNQCQFELPQLIRFVLGPKATIRESGDIATITGQPIDPRQLPSISKYTITRPTVTEFILLSRFNLTSLELSYLSSDPGPQLLATLSHLSRLSIVSPIVVFDFLTSIISHAPHLQHCEFKQIGFHSSDLVGFLQKMDRLESLTLKACYQYMDNEDREPLTAHFIDQLMTNIQKPRSVPLRIRIFNNQDLILIDQSTMSPAPRLVGIELNPEPLSPSIAQSLYADALHSIFVFLDLNVDYSLLHAASSCSHWMSAAESMKPQYLNECASESDPFGDSRGFTFHRQLYRRHINILLTSRLRHHVDSLLYVIRENESRDEFLDHLTAVGARLSHLHRLRVGIQLDRVEDHLPLLSHDRQLILPQRLRRLDLRFLTDETGDTSVVEQQESNSVLSSLQMQVTEWCQLLARNLTTCAPVSEMLPSSGTSKIPSLSLAAVSASSSSPLTHLSLQLTISGVWFYHWPQSALRPFTERSCDGCKQFPALCSLDIVQPTFQCIDLMRQIKRLQSFGSFGDSSALKRFLLGPSGSLGQDERGDEIYIRIDPDLPHLTEFEASDPVDWMLTSHFTHLTSLTINCLAEPEKLPLAAFKQLRRLTLYEPLISLLTQERLLNLISTSAPQLEHIKFDRLSLLSPQLSEFLSKMSYLQSLTLKECQHRTTSSDPSTYSDPEPFSKRICERLSVISTEKSRAHAVVLIRVIDDAGRVVTVNLSISSSPPSERLVGIELNPGPSNSIQRLYDDALHSIFSFIDIGDVDDAFSEFFSPALTCKRWYEAASTKRLRHPSTFGDISNFDSFHMQSLSIATSEHGALLAASRLRHVVSALHLTKLTSTNIFTRVNQITTCMSGIVQLTLSMRLHPSNPFPVEPMIHLPASLVSLSLTLMMGDFGSALAAEESTSWVDHIDAYMTKIATAATSCTQFCHLHLHVSPMCIQAAALRPWSCVSSLNFLSVNDPAQSCVDVMRTMNQLQRIDGIGDGHALTRFVLGTRKEKGEKAQTLSLPPLRAFRVVQSDAETLCLYSRFTHLTSIHLDYCMVDPGELLLTHLPGLQQLAIRVGGYTGITWEQVIPSIIRHSPQLHILRLMNSYSVTSTPVPNQLINELLQGLKELQSLILSSCAIITDLTPLLSARSLSLTHIHIINLPITRNQQLTTSQQMTKISPPLTVTIKYSPTILPPAAPLVGIEPNPGPSSSSSPLTSVAQSLYVGDPMQLPPITVSTSSSVPISQRLYDDVLHSIFSFINTGLVAYSEFISPALTCKRWFEAACMMRFHHSTVSDLHEFDSFPMPPLSLSTIESDIRVTSSRLRHCVTTIRLVKLTPTDLITRLNQITLHMSTITQLDLSLTLDPLHRLPPEELIRLPSSLISLSLLLFIDDFRCYLDPSEHDANDDDVQKACQHISECMTKFAIATSTLTHFRHLSLYIYKMHIPAAALKPWRHVESLTHLTVDDPSLPCVDIMRTMNQLQQIDGIDDESILERFVYGPSGHDILKSGQVLNLPSLTTFRLTYPDAVTMQLCSHFTHLTSLFFDWCDDAGKLLTHLPHLRRLEITAGSLPLKQLLPDLAQQASQLHHLKLSNSHRKPIIAATTNVLLADFLKEMKQLQSLTLSLCTAITTLIPLLADVSPPPSLTHLHITNLPITKEEELLIKLQMTKIRPPLFVTIVFAPPLVPPSKTLVGIELNPGPVTSLSQQLYDDMLHSAFTFIDIEGNPREFTSPALTCKRWLKAAETMKFRFSREMRYLSFDRVASIAQSRLRRLVQSIRYHERLTVVLEHWQTINFAERMSHLTRLHIRFQLESSDVYFACVSQAAAPELNPPTSSVHRLLLPSSLEHLEFLFKPGNRSIRSKDDESQHPPCQKRKAAFEQMGEIMRLFAASVVESNCHQLSTLEVSLVNPSLHCSCIPASSIQPWSDVASLRHLCVLVPTFQCIDVIRTMSHLKHISSFTYPPFLVRLIHGPAYASSSSPPCPPPAIETFHYAKSPHLPLLAHFPSLTDLLFSNCDQDPGAILLSKLPNLTRIAFIAPSMDHSAPIQDILNSLFKYAPRLYHLQIDHQMISEEQLAAFLPQMSHLESFTLGVSTAIVRLAFLESTHPSLTRVHLHHLHELASSKQLKHTQHFKHFSMDECAYTSGSETEKDEEEDEEGESEDEDGEGGEERPGRMVLPEIELTSQDLGESGEDLSRCPSARILPPLLHLRLLHFSRVHLFAVTTIHHPCSDFEITDQGSTYVPLPQHLNSSHIMLYILRRSS